MFGFPKAEYKVFNRNFLRKVLFKINFKKNTEMLSDEGFIKSIFSESFPRFVKAQGSGVQITFNSENPKLEQVKGQESIILKSSDGLTTLEINESSLQLSFDNTAYETSKDISSKFTLIQKLLSGYIKDVQRISLKKINIIEFENNNNPNGILYYLLDNSVVGNVDSFPNSELINHNIQSVNYRNDEYLLNLKYGMNIPPIEALKVGQVIIDIEIAKYTDTELTYMDSVFDNINDETYNVFCTLISENTKDLLNG